MFGDLSLPKTTYLKHWVARAACLIALPFSVYVASFALHFAILQNSGPGDAQMSSLFQAGLNFNDFRKNPLCKFGYLCSTVNNNAKKPLCFTNR